MSRKITVSAIESFLNAKSFKSDNTSVVVEPNVTILKLHGNPIAYKYNNPLCTLSIQTCGWESNTTKERLNGIPGISICQKKGQWYLNGDKWDGKLIDIILK